MRQKKTLRQRFVRHRVRGFALLGAVCIGIGSGVSMLGYGLGGFNPEIFLPKDRQLPGEIVTRSVAEPVRRIYVEADELVIVNALDPDDPLSTPEDRHWEDWTDAQADWDDAWTDAQADWDDAWTDAQADWDDTRIDVEENGGKVPIETETPLVKSDEVKVEAGKVPIETETPLVKSDEVKVAAPTEGGISLSFHENLQSYQVSEEGTVQLSQNMAQTARRPWYRTLQWNDAVPYRVVVLRIPADYPETLEVENGWGMISLSDTTLAPGVNLVSRGWGDVQLKGVTLGGDSRINIGSGELRLARVNAENLKIQGGHGDLHQVSAQDLRWESSGGVTMEELSLRSLEVTTQDGWLELRRVQAQENVSLRQSYGEIHMTELKAQNLQIESVNGAAWLEKLTLAGDLSVSGQYAATDLQGVLGETLTLTGEGGISLADVRMRQGMNVHSQYGSIWADEIAAPQIFLFSDSGALDAVVKGSPQDFSVLQELHSWSDAQAQRPQDAYLLYGSQDGSANLTFVP